VSGVCVLALYSVIILNKNKKIPFRPCFLYIQLPDNLYTSFGNSSTNMLSVTCTCMLIIKILNTCQFFVETNLGISTLKMRLRRRVQFVEELVHVKIAKQVSVKTVKVRSDIKDRNSNVRIVFFFFPLAALIDTSILSCFVTGLFGWYKQS